MKQSLSAELIKKHGYYKPDSETFELYVNDLKNKVREYVTENYSFFHNGDNLQDVYDNIKQFTIDVFREELKSLSRNLLVTSKENHKLLFEQLINNKFTGTNIKPITESKLYLNDFNHILLEKKLSFIGNINLKELLMNIKSYALPWIISLGIYASSEKILGLFQELITGIEPHFYYLTGVNSYDIADYLRNATSLLVTYVLTGLITRRIDNEMLTKMSKNYTQQSLELVMIISRSEYGDNYDSEIKKANDDLNKCVERAKSDDKMNFICLTTYYSNIDDINKAYFAKIQKNAIPDDLVKLNKVFKSYNKGFDMLSAGFKSLVSGGKFV